MRGTERCDNVRTAAELSISCRRKLFRYEQLALHSNTDFSVMKTARLEYSYGGRGPLLRGTNPERVRTSSLNRPLAGQIFEKGNQQHLEIDNWIDARCPGPFIV
jgi:hypothetical protein